MHARCRIVVALSLLVAACADHEDEPAGDVAADVLEARTADGCEYFVAPNFAHLLARRAYVTSHPVGFFRVFTYQARGTNDLIGLTPFRRTTLYKIGNGRYATSASKCPGRSDGGAVASPAPVADAGSVHINDPRDSLESPGCHKPPTITAGPGKLLSAGGLNRTYALAVPPNYDPNRAYPLVFAFHGLGSSSAQAERYFGLAQTAGNDAIIVYPDAVPDTRAWGITGEAAATDLAFFDGLVREVTDSLCVDVSRVFATGHSMGAFFANTLGCARGAVLRAIAPVSGGGPYVSCDNGKVAALLITAEDDPIVATAQVESSRDWWLRASGCQASTRPVGPASCVAYANCAGEYPVHWCLEKGGGHTWPSFAGAAIWRFFAAL